MFKSIALRSIVVLALVLVVLAPAAPVWAGGDGSSSQQTAADGGVGMVEEILDWLIKLVTSSDAGSGSEGDSGPEFDPSG